MELNVHSLKAIEKSLPIFLNVLLVLMKDDYKKVSDLCNQYLRNNNNELILSTIDTNLFQIIDKLEYQLKNNNDVLLYEFKHWHAALEIRGKFDQIKFK